MMKTVKKEKAGAAQFEHVEAGIYRNLNSGTYFERPTVNGKRSWYSLDTKNKTRAREELHKRRIGLAISKNAQTRFGAEYLFSSDEIEP